MDDYQQIYFEEAGKVRLLQPMDTRLMHAAQLAWLQAQLAKPFNGKTVVVTHHAPHRGSIHDKYGADRCSPAFVSDLPDSFFQVPSVWIRGHTHDKHDYTVGNCRIVCNPRGNTSYRRPVEVAGFDPALVIEV